MTKHYSIFLAVGLLIGHAAVGAVVAVNFAIRLVNDLIKDASPYLWRVVERVKLVAVRVIGSLKPVYRDSYQTDGQSLGFRWRPC
jgi:hypothetical protein